MTSLRLTPRDSSRLCEASAAVLLVGGCDGSADRGDVRRVAAAIETAAEVAGGPLTVAIVELETRDRIEELARRHPGRFGRAAFAFLDDGGQEGDGLVALAPEDIPANSVVYLYGGGLLDRWRGKRRVAHLEAVEELVGRRLPIIASEERPRAVWAGRMRRARERVRRLRVRIRGGRGGPPPRPGDPSEDARSARALAEEGLSRAEYALEVARDLSLPAKLLPLMSWLELQPPPAGPKISVVLATRERPGILGMAIDSVLAQRFREWELIVVDDGSDPRTRSVARASGDARVRIVAGPRAGLAAARNAGLDAATGEVVCYLDDDNVMHPGWLQAVAHVFSEREDVDVAYGVTIAEHRLPDDLGEQGWWPSFWQLPWSREALLRENVTDMGALAHRRRLEAARFDASVPAGEDWDLLLRLTADREALAVPAISHAYTMQGANRASDHPGFRADLEALRRRHAGAGDGSEQLGDARGLAAEDPGADDADDDEDRGGRDRVDPAAGG